MDIKRIIKECYEKICVLKFENIIEMDQFLRRHKTAKTHTRISIKETMSIINNLPKIKHQRANNTLNVNIKNKIKKNKAPDDFTDTRN